MSRVTCCSATFTRNEASIGRDRRVSRRARARQRPQNALFSLALAYKDEGGSTKHASASSVRASSNPRNGKVLWQLADLWMRQGDSARAEAIVTDALERKVDEYRFFLKLGEICIEAKRFDEAERAIKRALEKKPGRRLRTSTRPRVRREGAARQGDRLLRGGAHGTPERVPRRVQRRPSFCRRAGAAKKRSPTSAGWSRSNRPSEQATSISLKPCSRTAISPAPSNRRGLACRTTPSRG